METHGYLNTTNNPCGVIDFNAGHGGCETYAVDMDNYEYCSTDFDSSIFYFAYEVCAECGQCSKFIIYIRTLLQMINRKACHPPFTSQDGLMSSYEEHKFKIFKSKSKHVCSS